jgi:hypothetical protein
VTNRLEEIARRKQALVDKAGRERAELAAACDRIRSPFEVTSTLLGIGRTLRTHPIIAAGISSFLVSGYAGRLLKSTGELLKLWKLARSIWGWWKNKRKG